VKPAYANVIDGLLGRGLIQRIRETKDSSANPLIPEALARSERTKVSVRAE
jgi:hypothetical protein